MSGQEIVEKSFVGNNNGRNKNIMFLCVIIFLNLLNYVDRYTVPGTLTDIQKYYQIDDAQAGLITTVFVIAYMLATPIFGYCGDRYNRKFLICFGLFIWICAVFLSSASQTFKMFLFSRAIVGVGEAAYTTIAPTIIGDLFTDTMRSRMLMFFYLALPVGSGIGYVLGSQMAYLTGHWQWGLRVTPLIGLGLLIFILLYFDDPVRGQAERAHLRSTTYLEDIKSLSRIRTYIYSSLGFTCVVFIVGSMSVWTPTLCQYAWGLNMNVDEVPSEIKAATTGTFGLISCVGGLIGVSTGYLLSRIWQKGVEHLNIEANPRADPLVCAISALIGVFTVWMALFIVSKSLITGYIFMLITVTLLCMNFSLTTDIIMYITIPTRRTTAIAIQTLFSHSFGDAASPYIVGYLSDWIRAGDQSSQAHFRALQYAFFVPNFILIFGAFFYFWSAYYVEEDREKNFIIIRSLSFSPIVDDNNGHLQTPHSLTSPVSKLNSQLPLIFKTPLSPQNVVQLELPNENELENLHLTNVVKNQQNLPGS